MSEDHLSETPDRHGYEVSDAHIGPLVRFGVFLAVVTVVFAALMVGLYRFLDAREAAEKAPRYPMTVGVERPLPPPPRLQSYPFSDLKALRQEEGRLLERYGWIDRNRGLVRIPVDRAIEILAERGLPYREAPSSPAPGTGVTQPPAEVTEPGAAPVEAPTDVAPAEAEPVEAEPVEAEPVEASPSPQ
jgi:hypothetical protein